MELDIDKLDFDRCEDEPIHIPESIQGYGHLFALEQSKGEIKIISENVKDLLSDHENVVGRNFFDFLEDEEDTRFLQETFDRVRKRGARLPVRVKFKKDLVLKDSASDFYAVVFDSEDYFVIELEPAGKFRDSYSASQYIKLYAKSVAPKFKTYKGLGDMAQEIVETIRYITDYERVVLYRFNDDASGKVIAESKVDDMDSYLDLYYPASDIPPQARELYKKNWVRLTPNVDLEPSKLLPTIEESGRKPLDLTDSILRSISPIHRQYVHNQGLKASLSMSLVTHDKLWGMVSCHSRKPAYVPQNIRLECENLSQLFSWHLYAKEEEIYQSKKDKTDRAINNILDRTTPQKPIVEIFKENEEEVLKVLDTDGFIFYTDEESIELGVVPEAEAISAIQKLSTENREKPFVSDELTKHIQNKASLNGIAGVLSISLVENRNYFTAWFRKEHPKVERWAGAANEKNVGGSKRERLMPRTSFAVHEKKIINKSREWDDNDIEVAHRFNKVFMSHALETQHKMRQSIMDLRVQDENKNEFLATLAHELRNPLSPISVGISLLDTVDDADTRAKLINTMNKQVKHMTNLIDDLMDVSRITQGKIKLDKRKTNLQEIIKNAEESCQQIIREKKHHLDLNPGNEPFYTLGDNTRLTQIFVNILNNAAKYTDPGGKITVTMRAVDEWVSVKIKDNGLGIPPEKLETIFLMFTQIDAYSTHTKGGLGIGLTLVQRLVSLHGGKITARSEGLGKGTEFEVLLPLVETGEDINRGPGATYEKQGAGTRRKILVVDDNEDILSTYEILLNSEGYETRTASTGTKALAMFKEFKPDFALFDIGMPDIDGYELCKRLSSTPEARDTIFFSQSGWGNEERIQRAYDSGFQEHFVKPVDLQRLKETLRKFAEGKA